MSVTTAETVLEIQNGAKSFQSRVFQAVSLAVHQGEIVTLKGPSGIGKSTLLRCIAGLEKWDEGTVMIESELMVEAKNKKEQRCRNYKKIQKKIGLVFQNANLFPHYTVLENVTAPLLVQKRMTKEAARNEAMILLEKMGIRDKASSYPFTLSGGQKQRAAIARACILKPKLLCFDEPTSSLDSESAEDVAKLIGQLKSEGMAILIVTHDLKFSDLVCTRSVTMGNGRLTG